jgi:hypothetical protein
VRRDEDERAAPSLVLGVLVAPGLAQDVTERVVEELLEDLREHYGSVDWQIEVTVDRLVSPPALVTEIFDAARRRLLEGDWDLAVAVTDLPLRHNRRPAVRHVSRTHRVALVSLPALGAFSLRPRLRRTLLELVGELVGEAEHEREGPSAGLRRHGAVLRELAMDTAERPGLLGLLFVPAVLAGNLRLLAGMVRANRPWRLAIRLSRALAAAVATAAYGIVSSDVWAISAAMGSWRLALTSALAVAVTAVLIIVAHDLWEQAPDPRVREQVVLFNIATSATVAIGILTLYAALFGLVVAAAALAITPHLLEGTVGHPVDAGDYATLAWFVTSLGTVGGALGAILESDQAVREAAYAASPSDEAEDE